MSVLTIMGAVNKTATILLAVTTVVVILVILKVEPIVLVSELEVWLIILIISSFY